jgi:hypothetical protein
VAATAVDRGDDTLGPHGVGELLGEVEVDRPVAEERRADDDPVRAVGQYGLGAAHAPDTASDATGEPSTDRGYESGVVATAFRGVEIDELNPWKSGELPNPWLWIGGFDGQRLTLHQLDDVPVLKID